jgi:competence protein ComEC
MNKRFKNIPSFWHQNPLTRQLVFLVIGICSANQFSTSITTLVYLGSLIFLLSYLFLKLNIFKRNTNISRSFAFLTLLVSFFVGVFLNKTTDSINHAYYSRETVLFKNGVYRLIVKSPPIIDSNRTCKFSADLLSYKIEDGWRPGYGKVKCKVKLVDKDIQPILGKTIFISGVPKLPGFIPPNTASFDYREWLVQNDFIATLYASGWHSSNNNKLSIIGFAASIREKCLVNFKTNDGLKNESELASALLLGDRIGIDPNITQSFTEIGIIHLLAVSGLHVGLVFQSLTFVLSFCFRGKRFKTLIAALSLGSLWSYALMTGLSPSVCRASLMLSLAILGSLIQRKIPAFNLLASAAFILIIIEPQIIFDIGFLLSFSAVFGIFAISHHLSQIRRINSKLIRAILIACTISVSAQLATLPFTLYYFGRFPVYFLIANLVAIPLASLISYFGFAALVLQAVPFIGNLLIWITLKGIGLLIICSNLLSSLPSPTIFFESHNLIKLIALAWIAILILMGATMSRNVKVQFSLIIILVCSVISFPSPYRSAMKSTLYFEYKQNEVELTFLSSKGSLYKFKLGSDGFYSDNFSTNVKNSIYQSLSSNDINAVLIFAHPKLIPSKMNVKKYRILVYNNLSNDKLTTWIEKTNPILLVNLCYNFKKTAYLSENNDVIFNVPVWNIHKINKLEY